QKSKFLATQARDDAPHYQHSEIGYNYRLSNICAGIGRGQMEVIEERVAQRRANFDYYVKSLSFISGISFQPEAAGSFSNRWLSCVIIDPLQTGGISREDVRLALAAKNIEARPLWKPMHLQPVFEKAPFYGENVAENLFDHGLCLPSGSNLTPNELAQIVEVIQGCFQ
ncbi:MAG: DegT/DnrJ/EryC1/StrS family aminotransferase, partial [Runella zeae]